MAGVAIRALAAVIDFVGLLIFSYALIILCALLGFLPQGRWGHNVTLLVVLYFAAPLIFFSATPAMLLLGIRVRSEAGGALSFWKKLSFGALRSLVLFSLANMGFFFENDNVFAGWMCLVAAVLVIAFHGGLMIFTKSGRGLFDKLVGAVVIRPPKERK